MGIWSEFLGFVANPCSGSGCLKGVLDLSQYIHTAGVSRFVRRPESGKTAYTSLPSSVPQPQTAEEVRRTESRMKETNFYNLFRRSHLFNGKICLQHFLLCVLYIKCKIILSKNKAPFNEVRFSLRTVY